MMAPKLSRGKKSILVKKICLARLLKLAVAEESYCSGVAGPSSREANGKKTPSMRLTRALMDQTSPVQSSLSHKSLKARNLPQTNDPTRNPATRT